MENNRKFDTESICRVCLLRKSELFLIFDEIHAEESGVTISEILTECTRYKVGRYDNLPHQICGECMKTAREAFRFKRQAEVAYRTLVGLMDDTETANLNQYHKSVECCDKGTQVGKNSVHPCEMCDLKFFDVFDLREHRYTVHRGNDKNCKICGEKFQRMRQLRSHLIQQHPDEGLIPGILCSFCMRSFSRKEHLKRHLRSVHKQNLESTNVALESKTLLKIDEIKKDSKDDLPGWTNRADDEDDSDINDPNVSVTDWPESSNTTLSHRVYNKQCKVCDEKFENMRKMRSHMIKAHANEGIVVSDIQCTFCMRSFARKEHLRRHLRSKHNKNMESNKVSLEEPEIDLKRKVVLPDGEDCAGDENDSDMDDADMFATNPISSDDEEEADNFKAFEMRLPMLKLEPELNIKVEESNDANTDFISHDSMEFKSDEDPKNILKEENDDDFIDDTGVSSPEQSKKVKKSNIKGKLKVEIIREKADNDKQVKKRRSNKASNPENRCELCQRTFSRGCHLTRHMLTHLDEKLHECSFCSKRFARSDHMKKHILNVHNDKDFKCDQCTCAFARAEDLERHKVRHGTDPDAFKVHDCEYCGKKFTSKTYLRKHILMHTDRIFACKSCDETFKERKLLREHEKTHSAGRNFLCSICGESFVRNDYLRVHMRRHNGEKPFKCQYCDKGFPRATDVKIHERYHTGTKPNLCTLCGKGFHRAYNLTIHMRTHTGERPFKCDHCEKAFAQSNDLKSHIRRIHTGERYKCNVCDTAGFLHLYGLRQHSLLAHNIHIESPTGRLQKFLPNPVLTEQIAVSVPEHITPLFDLKNCLPRVANEQSIIQEAKIIQPEIIPPQQFRQLSTQPIATNSPYETTQTGV